MPLEWRQAHVGGSFDGYEGGRIVARVVRYGDFDHAAGHVLRSYYWQGFLNGQDAPMVLGRHGSPEAARGAVERSIPQLERLTRGDPQR